MRKLKIPVILFLLLTSLIVFTWFSIIKMYAGSEEGIPFHNLSISCKHFSYLWREVGGGAPNANELMKAPLYCATSFIQQLGVPSLIIQASVFFVFIFTGTFSTYLLTKLLLEGNSQKEKAAIIAGIFYMLNPYSLSQVWGRGLYLQFNAFALAPLLLFLLLYGYINKDLRYSLLAGISTLIFSGIFANPSYIVTVLFVVSFCSFYFFIFKPDYKKFTLLFFLTFVFVFVALHAWWILPYFNVSASILERALNASEENIGTLIAVSEQYTLPVILRLMHRMYFFEAKWYGELYSTIPVKILSYIPTLLVFAGLFSIRKTKFAYFLILGFIFSLLISLGHNFPIGELYLYVFKKINYLQAFRNPYEKFGVVYMLFYSICLSAGFIYTFNKFNKKAWFVILSLFTILVYPIWTKSFCGGDKFNCWIKVPNEYSQVNEIINKQGNNVRVAHLPFAPWDGLKYVWQNGDYQGVEPSSFIFDSESVAYNTAINKIFYNVLLQRFDSFHPNSFGPDPDISQSEFKSDTFVEELEKLNVRYIVLHNDIEPKISGTQEPEAIKEYLSNQENIDKVGSFGKLDLYEVKIDPRVAMIYSNENEVEFVKINPTFYKFRTTNLKDEFKLNFLNLYDQGWELTINGEVITDHQKLFSYANSWTIVKSGEISGEIKYKPQDKVILGSKISILSLTFVVALLFVFRNKIVAKS